MRIIDKNTDFYDYLQNIYPDKTFTFDRTDSFVLTKEIMSSHLSARRLRSHRADRKYHNFILLQICNTFWLFLAELTEFDNFDNVQNYEIELITTWRNYSKPRKLYTLDVIEFAHGINNQFSQGFFLTEGYDVSKVYEKSEVLQQAISIDDYKVTSHINRHIVYNGNDRIEKHVPLLKACGIAGLVEPLDVFLSLEEYFALEKTASERRDPIGATNEDKIESHGFDTRTSFRNIQ